MNTIFLSEETIREMMRRTFLEFSPPLIGEEEIAEVVDTLRSGWITTGPKVKRFEEEFAQFIGAQAALATSSATDAMLIGLAALGVGPGCEVITSPMTFCSTVHVIEHMGAHPVLADVEPDTLNLSPPLVSKAITSRSRAVMPVHLYGHPCEMDGLMEIAEKHQMHVLEDAAHALPSRYKGRTIGTWGKLTAFSFYATKNLTTAEGGMLTGDTETVERARLWSLHGMNRDAYKRYSQEGAWYYEVVLPGFKCNMTDIQAALGLQQLRKLPAFQKRRFEIVRRYHESFSQMEEVQIPTERPEVDHAWHLYVLRIHTERLRISRNQFIEELKLRRIGTSVHFIPIHLHPFYRDKYGFKPEDFPVAYREYQRMVSLPLHVKMTDQDVDDVIQSVSDIVDRFRR